MTWSFALGIVVAISGHERYRALCDEANPDQAQRDAFRRLMLMLAGGAPDPDLIPLPKALALHRLMRACPYRSVWPPCGCSGARCGLRAAIVSHRDCLDCVRVYGA
ncbi:MAG: hypothetical protein ACLP9L_22180 [Thermoguttaceae bacterium]